MIDFEKAIGRQEMRPGDYVEGGLIHCGTCHEPREQVFEAYGSVPAQKIPRQCACDRERTEREESERTLAERRKRSEQMRSECFPFEAMRDMTFDHDDRLNAKISDRCQRYAERFADALRQRAGLLFYGDVGGGKSYHAACIANRVIDDGYRATFTSIGEVASDMSAARFSGERQVLTKLCAHDLVVIDDLGAERSTDTALAQTAAIVDALSKSRAVVIFTTNMDPEAMRKETDATLRKVYSRVFGMCQPVRVDVPDRRLKVSEGKADFYKSIW